MFNMWKNDTKKTLRWTPKTPTCQTKKLLLDKTPKEHYYENKNTQETQTNRRKV